MAKKWITKNGNHILIELDEASNLFKIDFSVKDYLDIIDNKIRDQSNSPKKYEKQSSILREEIFLKADFNVIKYINESEGEDLGSISYIVLDTNVLEEPILISKDEQEEDGYVYHASNDNINPKDFDMSDCAEIGIHFGTLKAAKSFNRPYIFKTKLKDEKIIESNKDYKEIWDPTKIIQDIKEGNNFIQLNDEK